MPQIERDILVFKFMTFNEYSMEMLLAINRNLIDFEVDLQIG